MTDDVSVQSGAQTAELVSGVTQVKDKLGILSGKGEELTESFREIGDMLIEAFAVKEVAEFTRELSELGEQLERVSQMTGLSTDAVLEFQFAMKAGGGDAES